MDGAEGCSSRCHSVQHCKTRIQQPSLFIFHERMVVSVIIIFGSGGLEITSKSES